MQTCPHCDARLPTIRDLRCPDCCRALDDSPGPARLTGPQAAYVRFLNSFGPRGPSVPALYRHAVVPAIVWPLVVVAAAFAAFGLEREYLGWLFLGVALGVVARDNGAFTRTVQVWPALAAVIDWGRVAALAGDQRPTEGGGVRRE